MRECEFVEVDSGAAGGGTDHTVEEHGSLLNKSQAAPHHLALIINLDSFLL